MISIENFANLHRAKHVVVDVSDEIVTIYVWKGGHTVNILDDELHCFDTFSCGSYRNNHAHIEDVEYHIRQHIAEGYKALRTS